jgi:hypothetical protein
MALKYVRAAADITELMKILWITVALLALTGSAFASDVLSDTPEGKSSMKQMGAYIVDLMPTVRAELETQNEGFFDVGRCDVHGRVRERRGQLRR